MSYTYETGRTAAEVYDELHRGAHYGTTEHGLNTEHLYADCRSLLDVGCGRSPFGVRIATKLGLRVSVCDISRAAIYWQLEHAEQAAIAVGIDPPDGRGADHYLDRAVICDLGNVLPFDSRSRDAVTCFDVLEHLPEERVPFAIRELCRVARKRVVITVGTRPSVHKGPGGEPLHLTVHDHDWWMLALNAHKPEPTVVRTEILNTRIRQGEPVTDTVYIVELQP